MRYSRRERRIQGLCIGTFPKWQARFIRWWLKRKAGFNVELVLRGRGTPLNGKRYSHGIPVKQAKKVAIYVFAQRETQREWGHRIVVESLREKLDMARKELKELLEASLLLIYL